MAREYPDYRNIIEDLNTKFNGKSRLSILEVAEYDGCCDKTAKKRYGIGKEGINVCILARLICERKGK